MKVNYISGEHLMPEDFGNPLLKLWQVEIYGCEFCWKPLFGDLELSPMFHQVGPRRYEYAAWIDGAGVYHDIEIIHDSEENGSRFRFIGKLEIHFEEGEF